MRCLHIRIIVVAIVEEKRKPMKEGKSDQTPKYLNLPVIQSEFFDRKEDKKEGSKWITSLHWIEYSKLVSASVRKPTFIKLSPFIFLYEIYSRSNNYLTSPLPVLSHNFSLSNICISIFFFYAPSFFASRSLSFFDFLNAMTLHRPIFSIIWKLRFLLGKDSGVVTLAFYIVRNFRVFLERPAYPVI